MKHFEPLITHLSPLRTALVFIPETSEPASGSVRQNDASSGPSPSRPRYSFFSSSEAARTIGALASPLHDSDVLIPEQPQASSSSIRAPSRNPNPGPPCTVGRWQVNITDSQSVSTMVWPARVYIDNARLTDT